jgi:hypothetical protein
MLKRNEGSSHSSRNQRQHDQGYPSGTVLAVQANAWFDEDVKPD